MSNLICLSKLKKINAIMTKYIFILLCFSLFFGCSENKSFDNVKYKKLSNVFSSNHSDIEKSKKIKNTLEISLRNKDISQIVPYQEGLEAQHRRV